MVKYIDICIQTDKMRGKNGEIHPLNGYIKWETDIISREIIHVEFLKHTTALRCVILIIINCGNGKEDPKMCSARVSIMIRYKVQNLKMYLAIHMPYAIIQVMNNFVDSVSLNIYRGDILIVRQFYLSKKNQ